MLLSRLRYYPPFLVGFGVVYGAVWLALDGFPGELALVILVASLLKDLVDEVRIRRGGSALAYASLEHAPSNVVLLLLLAAGEVTPVGTVGGLEVAWLTAVVGLLDLALDVSQDLRQG